MVNQICSIELRQIRYFVAAAEHGSVRKASIALGVQESSVSRRIRDLEERVGASLFHRHNTGISLTFAGERFLKRATKILKHLREGARDVDLIGRSEIGSVKIGIFSSLASGFLTELLRMYGTNHSEVEIVFVDGNPVEHVAAIRQLRLDVAFVTGTSNWSECESAHLWSERVYAVLPEAHALTRKEEVTWSDMTNERFIVSDAAPGPEIYDYLIQRLARLGHRPEIQLQYVGRDNLFPLVALGRGLTVTSEATTAINLPGTTYRPIHGETLPFTAVWSPQNDNPACRRLLALARGMAQNHRNTGTAQD